MYFDTETTGLTEQNSIVQYAGIIVDTNSGKEETSVYYASPAESDEEISGEALEIQKRSLDEVKAYPHYAMMYNQIKGDFNKYVARFKKDKAYGDRLIPVGYNVEFDLKMLSALFERCGDQYFGSYIDRGARICLLSLANQLRSMGLIKTNDAKLATVAKALGIELNENAHDALADIKAARLLHIKMLNRLRMETIDG